MIQIPTFASKDALFKWLVANKSALITQKKSIKKDADSISYHVPLLVDRGNVTEAIKADLNTIPPEATQIKVRAIINTTKIMDSHSDVHIDGLWTKSLKETKDNYLVNEHEFCFAGIISDQVKAFTMQISWLELGFNYPGFTQALVYDAVIDKTQTSDPSSIDGLTMFDRYRLGKVKQHSVGMRYVKIDMGIDSEMYPTEKAIWDKYINMIVNIDDVKAQGYFWAVTEAKNIEGSAVVRGSNFATPTQSVQQLKGMTMCPECETEYEGDCCPECEKGKSKPGNTTSKQGAGKPTPIDVNKLLNDYSKILSNG